MALIKPDKDLRLEEIRVKINSDLKQEILAYCETFKIKNIGHFMVETAQYVLSKDKEWLKQKKAI